MAVKLSQAFETTRIGRYCFSAFVLMKAALRPPVRLPRKWEQRCANIARVAMLFILLSASLICAAFAEIIEIPLSSLLCYYTISDSRTAAFDIGSPISAVTNVWIRWSGTITPGLGHGDGIERPAGDWFPWPAEMIAIMDPGGPGFRYAYAMPTDGHFEETSQFIAFPNPGWDFLLDGAGEVRVNLDPAIIIGGDMVIPPVAVLEEAVLVLDVDICNPAVVEFDPAVLNHESAGRWVTCYIELPEGYDPSQVDVSTVILNETVAAEMRPAEVGDHDRDGIQDLMLKFSRSAILEALPCGGEVEVRLTGKVGSGCFIGADTIRVLCRHPKTTKQIEDRTTVAASVLQSANPRSVGEGALIKFELPERGHVSMTIYDVAGHQVRDLVDDTKEIGSYSVAWDGKDERGIAVSGGIYFVRLEAGGKVVAGKVVLVR
ncbi:MAG: FlgD immunoglobulin-like domain containing protein [Candidatus Eisenbacteria bacterium]